MASETPRIQDETLSQVEHFAKKKNNYIFITQYILYDMNYLYDFI